MLTGDLGAGKTELAKGLVAALGVDEPVVSPTFAIVREYEGTMPIHHLDVYRLDRVQEAIDLGLDELLDDGVTIIEWGEGIRELLPEDRLEISIALPDVEELDDAEISGTAAENTRLLSVRLLGPGWAARRGTLEGALAAVAETEC